MTFLAIWCAGLAWATVQLESPPTADQPTVVEVLDELDRPRSGETVRVLHRPGLAGEFEQAVGITDGRGRVKWTPAQGGVAHLRAGDEVHRIRVAQRTVPYDTWLLLGLLLAASLGAFGVVLRRAR